MGESQKNNSDVRTHPVSYGLGVRPENKYARNREKLCYGTSGNCLGPRRVFSQLNNLFFEDCINALTSY